ncbi:FHA domain-containing protein [Kribbella sp. NPDC020789]
MGPLPLANARPSDAERDRALAVLREGAGSGRLSHDTFVRRMNFVLHAQSRGELDSVLTDLPRPEPRVAGWMRGARTRLARVDVWRRLEEALGIPLARRERPAVPVASLALPPPGSPTVRIGRGQGATLRLADISVSRFHAELRHVGDGWMVRDLGSMNGTEHNGRRITAPVRVRPGDRLSFGAVPFTLTWSDEPE